MKIEQQMDAEEPAYDKEVTCVPHANEHASESPVEMIPEAYLLLQMLVLILQTSTESLNIQRIY